VPFGTAVNRLSRRRIRPYFLEADGSEGFKKKIYDVLSWLCAQLAMHYFVLPFQAMSWEFSLTALKNVHFGGHVVFFALYVLFSLVPVRKLPKKTE
jgi:hypothetical protein